jgi:hypothetical protein
MHMFLPSIPALDFENLGQANLGARALDLYSISCDGFNILDKVVKFEQSMELIGDICLCSVFQIGSLGTQSLFNLMCVL